MAPVSRNSAAFGLEIFRSILLLIIGTAITASVGYVQGISTDVAKIKLLVAVAQAEHQSSSAVIKAETTSLERRTSTLELKVFARR